MIIKTLVLNNFRVFAGQHSIDLTPKNGAPLVLFGGLNGAGKTSILTAIRLSLLGRLAFEQSSSNSTYINNLADLVYRSSNNNVAAFTSSVELHFEYVRDGKLVEYKISRRWNKGQRDNLLITENDIERIELNYEQAQSFLLELVPPGIADLVFFDGEKIAELADDNSGSILKDAVKRLLGLDTVLRLKEDLRIYLKRAGIASAETKLQKEFEQLELDKTDALNEARYLRNEADQFYNAIVEYNSHIKTAEQTLLNGGGAWANDREEQKKSVDQLIETKADTQLAILKELDGAYALSLAPNILSQLNEQLKQEQTYKAKQNFASEFRQFLPALRETLNTNEQADVTTLELINSEVKKLANNFSQPLVSFGFSDQQAALLSMQITQQSKHAALKVREEKEKLIKIEYSIENASINIARAPEKEQLQQAFDTLRGIETKKNDVVKKYKSKLEEAKAQFSVAHKAAQRLLKLHAEINRSFGHNESTERASSVIALLDDFNQQLTGVRVKELEKEFTNSYRKLARKEDLHLSASIDIKSFEVHLLNEDKTVINRKSLSAGEKQIYAIAMLDALGKVSGKKLPVVVDTPLGRLDSKHRDKLMEHYFPEASEQVIILSTDTEVDQGFFETLKDDIAHSYQITFDSQTQSSSITDGYFWNDNQYVEAK
jgi:DNA sulfur modification protein DndD